MENLLNDDCWMWIFQYLELEDQLALREVAPNLKRCVSKHWKSLKTAQIEGLVLEKFFINTSLMFEFASTVCGSLQKLTINGNFMDLLNSWRRFSFSNLHTLDCNWKSEKLDVLYPIMENALMDQWLHLLKWQQADEISMILTEVFPNLRKLTLRGNVRGCHLWRLTKLEELHICKPPISDTDQFLSRILIIPKLYKLNLHAPQSLITFATQNPLKVKSIRFIRYRSPLRLLNMDNLQKLAIHGCELGNEVLNEICEIASLEEVHLTDMNEHQLPNMKDLWKMVANLKHLKILNLHGSCFNVPEFDMSKLNYLENALRLRRFPLMLHIGPKSDSAKMLQSTSHPMLTITFEPIELVRKNVFCSKYLEIEFISGQLRN